MKLLLNKKLIGVIGCCWPLLCAQANPGAIAGFDAEFGLLPAAEHTKLLAVHSAVSMANGSTAEKSLAAPDSSQTDAVPSTAGGHLYLSGTPDANMAGMQSGSHGQILPGAGQKVELHDTALPGVAWRVDTEVQHTVSMDGLQAAGGEAGLVGAALKSSVTPSANQLISDPNGRVFLSAEPTITTAAITHSANLLASTSVAIHAAVLAQTKTTEHEDQDADDQGHEDRHWRHGYFDSDDSPTRLLEQTVVTAMNWASIFSRVSGNPAQNILDNDNDTALAESQELQQLIFTAKGWPTTPENANNADHKLLGWHTLHHSGRPQLTANGNSAHAHSHPSEHPQTLPSCR